MDRSNREIQNLLKRAPDLSHSEAAIELQRLASRDPVKLRRPMTMLRFRRAHDAHRDARLVFRAAAEGRPLELQKRLVLGKLAGGLDRTSCITADQVKYMITYVYVVESFLREARLFPGPLECTPLGASMLGGHDDCTKVLI